MSYFFKAAKENNIDFAVDVQLAVLGLDVDGAVSGLIVMDIGIFAKGNIEFTVLKIKSIGGRLYACPSPRDRTRSRMPSSA